MRAGRKIQVGQVWKRDGSDDTYLVTKIYSEALATFAVLRKAGAETEAPLRIRVERKGASQALPGFTFAQESDEF
jgi:Fe-S cluster assembly iron-binding protein IscA